MGVIFKFLEKICNNIDRNFFRNRVKCMRYSADQYARYIIARYYENREPLSALKLQKILYYLQGYSLKYLNRPAFDDPIEVWTLGPTVSTVFNKYHRLGEKAIYLFQKDRDEATITIRTPSDTHLLDILVKRTLKTSDYELTLKVRKEAPVQCTNMDSIIALDYMQSFFNAYDPLLIEKEVYK